MDSPPAERRGSHVLLIVLACAVFYFTGYAGLRWNKVLVRHQFSAAIVYGDPQLGMISEIRPDSLSALAPVTLVFVPLAKLEAFFWNATQLRR